MTLKEWEEYAESLSIAELEAKIIALEAIADDATISKAFNAATMDTVARIMAWELRTRG